ncbi:LuxR C-terminal-related transcriptional regulator [Streptomyces sp. CBMA123]|uniref:LuxR C-terminal-related transcriptional regulator n=1 Tax=Streptomyces sp. CBMA123 TaxID=1896313 RepID=UPI001661EA51|nr:LuxR C-terminal-related transcriptional regulator [Streptomyces sp. CBMA123]
MREGVNERRLRELMASAAAGRRGLVLVEGEAGMGRTTFVRRLLSLPEAARTAAVVLRVSAGGAAVAWEPGTATPAPDPGRSAPAAVEEWGGFLAARPSGLLVVEDVHHADPSQRRALRRLLEHPPADLCTVLTYRPEELPEPGLALGATVDYPPDLTVVRVRLEPLDVSEIRRLAEQALGGPCPPHLAARLHHCSGGTPQVVADVLADLAQTPDRTAAPAPPVRLAELALGRTAALPPAQRRIVWAAAVLEDPACAAELSQIAGLPGARGRTALLAAVRTAALHQLGPDRYGFRVPLAATAVRCAIPGPTREELHCRAAELLARRQPVPWARMAGHHHAAGQAADWLDSLAKAAEEAAGTGAHQIAIALVEEALAEPSAPGAVRARLGAILARSAVAGLSSEQTAAMLRQVVADCALPRMIRGEIRLSLGLLLLNHLDRSAEARGELVLASDELSDRPEQAARALAALASPHLPGSSAEENRAWLDQAEAAVVRTGDPAARTAILASRIPLLMSMGDPDVWRLLADLPRTSDDPRHLYQCARALCNAADGAFWQGRYDRSADLLGEALDLAAQSGAPHVDKVVRLGSAVLDWATGRWSGLPDRVRALMADADRMPCIVNEAQLVLGVIALAKGDWKQFGVSFTGPEPPDREIPHRAVSAGARIRLALARDETAEAAEQAAAIWATLRTKGVWAWAAHAAPWAVEATIRADRPHLARAMVAELAAGLEGRDIPFAHAALEWCQGLLAESDGDPSTTVTHYRQARAAYRALPRPHEAALLAEYAGRAALAADPLCPAGADELLSAAAELDELGASWDAARVRALLRRTTAERRPPGRPSYGEQLSPREKEVAALAATGMTNREIATQLHLSPRTVEHHVARAMRKLRIVSRLDLAGTGQD